MAVINQLIYHLQRLLKSLFSLCLRYGQVCLRVERLKLNGISLIRSALINLSRFGRREVTSQVHSLQPLSVAIETPNFYEIQSPNGKCVIDLHLMNLANTHRTSKRNSPRNKWIRSVDTQTLVLHWWCYSLLSLNSNQSQIALKGARVSEIEK